MLKKKILYAISSVGTGNLCRTLAILHEFPVEKYELRFITQGRAYEYLKDSFYAYRLHEITYSNKDFSLLSILRENYLFPYKLLRNLILCGKVIDEFCPDVIITDSDFCCLYPAYKRKIPVISINSSMATVKKFQEFRTSIFSMFFSFYFIEKVDSWLQKKFADKVICPIIKEVDIKGKKCYQVNPIVRQQFLDNLYVHSADFQYDLVVMFGGSGIGSYSIDLRNFKKSCVVLGQKDGLKLPPQADCIDYTTEPVKYLSRAKIVLVQGGFNSISEIIALKKPSVFVPIEGHAEQFVNALWAEKLGLGIVSKSSNVLEAINYLENNYSTFLDNCLNHNIICNGASQTAKYIEEFI